MNMSIKPLLEKEELFSNLGVLVSLWQNRNKLATKAQRMNMNFKPRAEQRELFDNLGVLVSLWQNRNS